VLAEYDVAARLPATSRLALWAGRLALPLTALGVAAWIESARFALRAPSLIDEWFALSYSGRAAHGLLHGHYLAAGSDFAGRYRPGMSAVWNYAQWHLLGIASLGVADAWGIVRTAAFFVAVWLLAKSLFGRPLRASYTLLLLAPLAVVLTPPIAVALARFGPGEPLMVAGIVIGLSVIASGTRRLQCSDSRRSRGLALLAIAVGYLAYLLGVYSKESSVALLAGLPFFAKWLAPELRAEAARGWIARARLGAFGALLIAPPLHVGVHLGLAAIRGTSPWPNAHLSVGLKIYATLSPLLGVPGVLGTWAWFLAVLVAIGVTGFEARRRNKDAWLLAGVLVTGYLMSAIPLTRGPMPTWYYIPWVAAVAAVAFRGLAYASGRARFAVVALATVLIPLSTPAALAEWKQTEQSGSTAISLSKGVVAAGCPLYLANFDIEQRVALPLLFGFGRTADIRSCSPSSQSAYAVSWKNKPLSAGFASGCRGGWTHVEAVDNVGLYRCSSLRPMRVLDQYSASGEPTVTVVRVQLPVRRPPPEQIFQPLPSLQASIVR
jgi:hypothetical protein